MMFRSSLFSLITFSAGSVRGLSTTAGVKVAGARNLGGSDLVVSEACLGTMTWGVQNSQEDAFEQLDYARSMGVNFIDTAELYPVPLTAPEWRAGATEEILGNYLNKIGSSERDELVIASKIAGFFPNSPVAAARTVPPTDPPPNGRLDAKSVQMACDASLRRLQTDHIDLMQIHWPDRYVVSMTKDSVSYMNTVSYAHVLFLLSFSLFSVKPNSNMTANARIPSPLKKPQQLFGI